MYRKAINNEKGVALILIAVSIIVLFGFGALAIDVGHLYNVKNQLQAAADAAALAGASEMGSGDLATMASNAYTAADRVAMHNYADVAAVDTPNALMGKPIPVKLNENAGNSNSNNQDIYLGIWDGNNFTVSSDTTLINAVKVVARRTGATTSPAGAQPRVNNWFAKVFSLLPLGPTFDLSSISAVAIAAKEPGEGEFVPIAVNEYWDEGPYDTSIGAYTAKNNSTYGQIYPDSFMRQTNANNTTSTLVTNIFAIFSADADKNNGPNNMAGYIDIL